LLSRRNLAGASRSEAYLPQAGICFFLDHQDLNHRCAVAKLGQLAHEVGCSRPNPCVVKHIGYFL
jgi:hypothetical protein